MGRQQEFQRRRSRAEAQKGVYDQEPEQSFGNPNSSRLSDARSESGHASDTLDDIDSALEDNSSETDDSQTQSSYSPEDISDRESQGDADTSSSEGDKRESAALAGAVGGSAASSAANSNDTVGKGFNPNNDSAPAGKLGKAAQITKAFMSRRSTKVGGGTVGVVAIVLTFLGITGVQMQFLNMRENMLGRANQAVNEALQNRRNQNYYKTIARYNDGKLSDKVTAAKLKGKLEKQGFKVDVDGKKITGISFEAEDENGKKHKRSVDLRSANAEAEFKAMFKDPIIGKAAARKLDASVGGRASTWKGKAARILYGRMKIHMSNWLDRKPSDKANSKQAEFADNLRHKTIEGADGSSRVGGITDNDLQQDGNDPEKQQKLLGDAANSVDGAAEYQKRLLDDPNDTGDINGTADGGVGAVDRAGGSLEEAIKNIDGTTAGKAFAKAALSSISALGVYQSACTVNGTLKFIANLQNILIAYQLAKLEMQFMMVPDHQKAGIVTSEGMKLMALWLNKPNPNTGKSASQSGGIRRMLWGDQKALPSPTSLSRYSTSRAPRGLLGQVSSYVNNVVQGIGGAKGCKIVNNGFVQAGALVVGIGAAIFTGGGTSAGQIATSIGLAIAGQLAIEVGKAMVLQSAAGFVVNGWENGEQAGDALASGTGAMNGMNANANGLRPATRKQVAILEAGAQETARLARAEQSLFDRYLSMTNGTSALTTTAAAAVPYTSNPTMIANSIIKGIGNMPNALFGVFNAKASAQIDPAMDCDDPQYPIIRKNDLKTDVFCNLVYAYAPDLNIDQTEKVLRDHGQIDEEGAAVSGSEYSKYIDLCLFGRPGILYSPTVAENGNDEGPAKFEYTIGGGEEKNACIVAGKPLPGDQPGRFDRYTAWFGYKVDEANFVEEISGEFKTDAPSEEETANKGDYFSSSANDPCPAGTDDLKAHTGYSDGKPVQIKLCGITNLPGGGEISNPGSKYYIQGANNHAVINARAAKQFYDMAAAAKSAGITLVAGSSFRTNQQQIDLQGGPNQAAKPGYSNHQMGLAVDFDIPGVGELQDNCINISGECTRKGNRHWDWLSLNSDTYGLKQLDSEFWHYSVNGK